MNSKSVNARLPKWYGLASILGLIWNLFGAFQFSKSVMATKESLVSMGMTDAQAQMMSSYPTWMTVAFAIGTFGGVVGCVLLLVKSRFAKPVFALSLAGYIVLFIGDITEGIFAALGAPQVVILTFVVLIAAALLWLANKLDQTIRAGKHLSPA